MQQNVLICLLSLSLFLLADCRSHSPEVVPPSTVLSKDSMLSVLTDLQLLEAGIDLGLVPITGATVRPDKQYAVFKKHGISRAYYDSSLVFYSAHPELLSKIYEKLISDLSKKQAEK